MHTQTISLVIRYGTTVHIVPEARCKGSNSLGDLVLE